MKIALQTLKNASKHAATTFRRLFLLENGKLSTRVSETIYRRVNFDLRQSALKQKQKSNDRDCLYLLRITQRYKILKRSRWQTGVKLG